MIGSRATGALPAAPTILRTKHHSSINQTWMLERPEAFLTIEVHVKAVRINEFSFPKISRQKIEGPI